MQTKNKMKTKNKLKTKVVKLLEEELQVRLQAVMHWYEIEKMKERKLKVIKY